MLEIIRFVLFPISVFMVYSSRWGSDSDPGDDGCIGIRLLIYVFI